MRIYNHKYHEIVRLAIYEPEHTDLKVRESISFIETTLQEVINHFTEKCKPYLEIDNGIKIRVIIRISHPTKRWGDQRCFTLRVSSIHDLVEALKDDLEEY